MRQSKKANFKFYMLHSMEIGPQNEIFEDSTGSNETQGPYE